jgi:hypothetical protein
MGEGQTYNALKPSPSGDEAVNWSQWTDPKSGELFQVNPRTGAMRPVMRPDGRQALGEIKGDRETVAQQKAQSLLGMGQNAYNRLVNVDQKTGQRSWKQLPTTQGRMLQFLTPDKYESDAMGFMGLNDDQAVLQNTGQLIDQWLRHVSGAAVPETEYARYINLYAPRATESDEVKANKLSAVTQMLSSLSLAAGASMTKEQALAELEANGRHLDNGSGGSGQRAARVNPWEKP